MSGLKTDAKKLEEDATKAIFDMSEVKGLRSFFVSLILYKTLSLQKHNEIIYGTLYHQVRSQIVNTTNEMSEIADGLGSGVSPDKIRTSISYGEDWLQEMKQRGEKR